jgi:organic radical activating enzyme
MSEVVDLTLSRMESGSELPQIFDTIQGEGRHAGEPSTFVRLSGCNLTCSWCDVPETWRFENSAAESAPHDDNRIFRRAAEEMSLDTDAVADIVVAKAPRRLIVTGGEPLLQQGRIVDLIDKVWQRDPSFATEIETNGTIAPKPELAARVGQFNVSPKLENSGNYPKKRDKPRAMEAFVALPQADFKFVISTYHDLEEALSLVDKYDIPPQRVFLMPEGRTAEKIQSGQRQLVDFCIEHGFNLSGRLHIALFGDVRGT